MTKLTIALNGVAGEVKFFIHKNNDEIYQLNILWRQFDDRYGFITNNSNAPIFTSEVAAEQLLRMITSSIILALDDKDLEIKILNQLIE